jgi:hypothetical protein
MRYLECMSPIFITEYLEHSIRIRFNMVRHDVSCVKRMSLIYLVMVN